MSLAVITAAASEKIELRNADVRVTWEQNGGEWRLGRMEVEDMGIMKSFGNPIGSYTILYSEQKPSEEPVVVLRNNGDTVKFVEDNFHYLLKSRDKALSPVRMNRAGEAFTFFPSEGRKDGGKAIFTSQSPVGELQAEWSLNRKFPNDIMVKYEFTAGKDGYYSLATPTVAELPRKNMVWGVIPGYFMGAKLNPEFRMSYLYGHGLPELPVICEERTITTMISTMQSDHHVSLAVIPESGYDRNAYEKDQETNINLWLTGLSHMDRAGRLVPTAYHPILGERGSYLKKGDKIEFAFRYSLIPMAWNVPFQHAIYDVYGLRDMIKFKNSTFSLTDRLSAMHKYVVDDKSSLWRVEEYNGMKIGAQSYMGGVTGSDKDAMKNSDVGSVWMMAAMTGDPRLTQDRLPYIRNFKIAQQIQDGDPFLTGAAQGQYFLWKKKKFVEEWGDHVEPIALTYYTLVDIGNILLFEPGDKELMKLFRAGADRLLAWQKPDGSFDVAYDRRTHKPLYTDLKDLRPTFYGFVVAYRITGEQKYLDAAMKGADWFIKNASDKGFFIGVCGDTRFINDFATGQSAQALLDLYDISGSKFGASNMERYKEAAIRAATFYTTSVYTHARATDVVKSVAGKQFQDWQISQVGLSFEHGGTAGSANIHGPILLASHCGLFVRMHALTGDRLFLDMARAAAISREAHLNPENKVSSYYWNKFSNGPGSFPMHAWWQIGWITDYLLAEAQLRSGGEVSFPRGFCAPKVGPHQMTGFAPGTIYGDKANLVLKEGLAGVDNANVDLLTAMTVNGKYLYAILLNSSDHRQQVALTLRPLVVGRKTGQVVNMSGPQSVGHSRHKNADVLSADLERFDIRVIRVEMK